MHDEGIHHEVYRGGSSLGSEAEFGVACRGVGVGEARTTTPPQPATPLPEGGSQHRVSVQPSPVQAVPASAVTRV